MTNVISNVAELVAVANTLRAEWNGELWWRGQSSSDYSLVPGVHRTNRGTRAEQNLTLRFRQYARTRHQACPEHEDFCSWLFLAQHYGLPTRLLDWSESALVAMFFASIGNLQLNGTLFVIHPRELNRITNSDHTLVPVTAPPATELFRGAFDDREPYKSDKTLAILSHEIDIRMLIQQGTFTIHGSSIDLRDINGSDRILKTYTVPAHSKLEIIAELASLGIRRRTLFPDLANLADDLKQLVFSENSVRNA